MPTKERNKGRKRKRNFPALEAHVILKGKSSSPESCLLLIPIEMYSYELLLDPTFFQNEKFFYLLLSYQIYSQDPYFHVSQSEYWFFTRFK